MRAAHEDIPSSETSWLDKADDESGVVAGYAHLTPEDESSWFPVNEMGRFTRGGSLDTTVTVNDVANNLTLRCDLRYSLDSQSFVCYPACDRKYVTYLVGGSSGDHAELLRAGREVITMPLRVSDGFPCTRFAYNIIKLRRPVFRTRPTW